MELLPQFGGTSGQIRNRTWRMRGKDKLTALEKKRLVFNIKHYLWKEWKIYVSTLKYGSQNRRTEITENLNLYTMSSTFQGRCLKWLQNLFWKLQKKNSNEFILYLVPEVILMTYLGIGRNGCIKSHVSVSQLEKSYRKSSEMEHIFAQQKL